MEKISYIVPLNKYNKTVEKHLKATLESIDEIPNNENNKIIFVGAKSVLEKVAKIYNLGNDATFTECEDSDFYRQINVAAMQCVTPYFSIIEFGDRYKPYWLKTSQEYAANGASVLIPINEVLQEGKTIGITNEIAWSTSFANAKGENESARGLGYIDLDCLDTFSDFTILGSLIKTEDFISVGMFKPSLKFMAVIEFYYRMAYNGKLIYVFPKMAYEHNVDTEDAYSFSADDISEEEAKWLFQTAKQEYFFKEDRNKKFENEPSEA